MQGEIRHQKYVIPTRLEDINILFNSPLNNNKY